MSDLLKSWYAECAARGFDVHAATRAGAERSPRGDFDIDTERREGWDYQQEEEDAV